MSTNAYIQVEGSEVAVYKHWDGGPKDTLPWLRTFHKRFLNSSNSSEPDQSYETAQLIRSSIDLQNDFNLDGSRTTGWGVEYYPNMDQEIGDKETFFYILYSDGSITVNGHKYLPDEEIVFDNGTTC